MQFGNKQEQREQKREQRRLELQQQQIITEKSNNILVVSTDFITGQNLQTLELVTGSNFVFSGVMDEKEINKAITSMRQSAAELGADAIINYHYAPSANHAYVWGTAVKFV